MKPISAFCFLRRSPLSVGGEGLWLAGRRSPAGTVAPAIEMVEMVATHETINHSQYYIYHFQALLYMLGGRGTRTLSVASVAWNWLYHVRCAVPVEVVANLILGPRFCRGCVILTQGDPPQA